MLSRFFKLDVNGFVYERVLCIMTPFVGFVCVCVCEMIILVACHSFLSAVVSSSSSCRSCHKAKLTLSLLRQKGVERWEKDYGISRIRIHNKNYTTSRVNQLNTNERDIDQRLNKIRFHSIHKKSRRLFDSATT